MKVSTLPKLVVSARAWTRQTVVCAGAFALLAACTERPGRTVTEGDSPTPILTPLLGAEVLAGAGDIASCDSRGDEATAALLDRIPGTVFTAGDNVYPSGTAERYALCYGPSWGRHLARTRPIPGNHDYRNRGGAAYYAYFGERAGAAGIGYYSFALGDWLIVMLNTNIGIDARSSQVRWLRDQLASRAGRCEIVVTHHARFSSGPHGSSRRLAAVWQVLYESGVELMISGHDHIYERFAPMSASGAVDEQRGVRQLVVGTGGFKPYEPRERQPNSQRLATTVGVIKLSLGSGMYQWEFVPAAGHKFRDAGEGRCR